MAKVFPTGMAITVELVDSDAKIKKKILNEFALVTNKKFVKLVPTIRAKIETALTIFYMKTTIFKSLVGGELAGHFGLISGVRYSQVLNIIQQICASMIVKWEPLTVVGNKFNGGYVVEILDDSYSDILSMSEAIITTKTDLLPWLKWLLLEGDKILVVDFEVSFTPGAGRSGKAIMIGVDSGAWRVPAWAAGTRYDNWLTRGLQRSGSWFVKNMKQIIQDEMLKVA